MYNYSIASEVSRLDIHDDHSTDMVPLNLRCIAVCCLIALSYAVTGVTSPSGAISMLAFVFAVPAISAVALTTKRWWCAPSICALAYLVSFTISRDMISAMTSLSLVLPSAALVFCRRKKTSGSLEVCALALAVLAQLVIHVLISAAVSGTTLAALAAEAYEKIGDRVRLLLTDHASLSASQASAGMGEIEQMAQNILYMLPGAIVAIAEVAGFAICRMFTLLMRFFCRDGEMFDTKPIAPSALCGALFLFCAAAGMFASASRTVLLITADNLLYALLPGLIYSSVAAMLSYIREHSGSLTFILVILLIFGMMINYPSAFSYIFGAAGAFAALLRPIRKTPGAE